MKLYEFAPEFERILSLVGEDGEMTPDVIAALNALEMDFKAKIDNICRYYRQECAKAAAFQAEAQRLGRCKAIADGNADRLKAYLKQCMEQLGLTRIETALFTPRIQKNSAPSITWTKPLDELPLEYRRSSVEPDMGKAREALKEYGYLPDGFTVERGTHLRVI